MHDALLPQLMLFQAARRTWLIDEDHFDILLNLDGQVISKALADQVVALRQAPQNGNGPADGVAVLPLQGTLMPDSMDLFSMLFGTPEGGLSSFRQNLKAMAADNSVGAIVMNVDSPGGVVDQIPETAREIRQARAQKPVVAVANTAANSAAYWLASQADQIVVTDSGDIGSIGVYRIHKDVSAQNDMRGVKPTVISAGKYKTEGHPHEPLSDEAQGAIQNEVNDYYSMFVKDVAKGRGVTEHAVRTGFGEGRSLHAKQAVEAGLADRVDTLDATVRRLGSDRGRTAVTEQRAERIAQTQDDDEPLEEIAAILRHEYSAEDRSRLLAVLAN